MHWKQLVRLPDAALETYDIALVNLACAADLPDAPGPLDVMACQHKLDGMAQFTRPYTERRLPEFRQQPAVYDGSEAKFRMVCLIAAIQKLGVRYNPAKKSADAPFYSADTFIHGALLGAGGTCASLPVVYTAVGRRLGYPLKLVQTVRHLFCRWEDPSSGERFNIEANDGGVSAPSDDYYRQGLYAAPQHIFEAGCYLQSQTPREELAGFLAQQGYLWQDLKRYKEACAALVWASVLAPRNVLHQRSVKDVLNLWADQLDALRPWPFPKFCVTFPPRRYPEFIPVLIERQAIFYEMLEQCLTNPQHERDWLGALRRGQQPARRMPTAIHVSVFV